MYVCAKPNVHCTAVRRSGTCTHTRTCIDIFVVRGGGGLKQQKVTLWTMEKFRVSLHVFGLIHVHVGLVNNAGQLLYNCVTPQNNFKNAQIITL